MVKDKFTLQESIATVYLVKPNAGLNECKTSAERRGKVGELKKAKDGDKQWRWIEESKAIKGWCEYGKLDRYSPFDWREFGFKALEAGTDYCYTVEDTKAGTKNAAFIKKVWEQLDLNGDRIISKEEWNLAFRRSSPLRTLSKLVCKHTNEWAYEKEEVKDAMKELYDLKIKESTDKNSKLDKQYLEKERDKHLALLKEQLEHLLFWKHVEEGEKDYTDIAWDYLVDLWDSAVSYFDDEEEEKEEEQKEESKRYFPSEKRAVWHFHPIAFVEQMMRLVWIPK